MSSATGITFKSLEESEQFKAANAPFLARMEKSLQQVKGVAYTEVWLSENAPSTVKGFNSEDEIVTEAVIDVAEVGRMKDRENALGLEWDNYAKLHGDKFDALCEMPNEELKQAAFKGCKLSGFILEFRAFYCLHV